MRACAHARRRRVRFSGTIKFEEIGHVGNRAAKLQMSTLASGVLKRALKPGQTSGMRRRKYRVPRAETVYLRYKFLDHTPGLAVTGNPRFVRSLRIQEFTPAHLRRRLQNRERRTKNRRVFPWTMMRGARGDGDPPFLLVSAGIRSRIRARLLAQGEPPGKFAECVRNAAE